MITTAPEETLNSPDRAAVDAIVATLVHHVRREHPRPTPRDPARRDAHPKHHGCVPATFEIAEGLSEDLRQGLFARAGTYQAWVRFSNAFKVRHDLDRDARGMAIKVMGVPGDEGTQDFLLVTHHSFFARTPADFVDFPAAVAGAGSAMALITRVVGFFFGLRPFRFKLPGFMALQRSMNWCTSPLVLNYFSQTPYQFGVPAAKFRARARQRESFGQRIGLWARVLAYNVSFGRIGATAWQHSLRDALRASLRTGTAVFDFEVQVQQDDMPIDDAVVAWSTRRSPYRTVATLTIQAMPGASDTELETMMVFGQHLSFTPWHTSAHEPRGSINAARRSVYEAISALRHGLNHVTRREPRPGEAPAAYLRDVTAPSSATPRE